MVEFARSPSSGSTPMEEDVRAEPRTLVEPLRIPSYCDEPGPRQRNGSADRAGSYDHNEPARDGTFLGGVPNLHFLRAPIQEWWRHKAFSKTYFVSNHYYTVYISYLIVVMTLTSVVLATSDNNLSALDSVYLSVSAGTMTGLSTVDFTATKLSTQIVIWLHIIACSPMLMNLLPVVLRRRSYRRQRRMEIRQGTQLGQALTTGVVQPVEYLAMGYLMRVVMTYYIVVQVIGWLLYWVLLMARRGNHPQKDMDGAGWAALFLSTSAFHNAGLATIKGGLPFLDQHWSLSATFLTIVAVQLMMGNTFFPICLRAILVSRSKFRQDPALDFLLKYPRRCYTHLFAGNDTMWLIMISLVLIVCTAMPIFVSLVCWDQDVDHSVKWSFLTAFFHAASARTAGISVVDFGRLGSMSCFVLCVSMWISTSPVVVAMRSTREVRENPGWDVFGTEEYNLEIPRTVSSLSHIDADDRSVGKQVKTFMTNHSALLLILFFMILAFESATENVKLLNSTFLQTTFEFCSAWGTVGLSITETSESFSGQWTAGAQLSLMVVMFLGRLRGLPEAVDPSVSFVVETIAVEQRDGNIGFLVCQPSRSFQSSTGPASIGNMLDNNCS
mmetsp:Transcript_50813/g.135602  ORF Transcript_50813/g.135602 Transcript_50813/m.135602 type:complete len:612 (-) Transcript_50813:279-2114(-)